MNLNGLVGKEMVSPWREVTQEQVTAFADVTGDRQWIHVDGERARRESPYGGTIAHGFYTLSMASGSLVRARCTLQRIDPADGGVQATWNVVIERDGSGKPCCVAEWLVRYLS